MRNGLAPWQEKQKTNKKKHYELKAGVESKRAQKTKEQLCSTEHMANKVKQMFSTTVAPIIGTSNVIICMPSTSFQIIDSTWHFSICYTFVLFYNEHAFNF